MLPGTDIRTSLIESRFGKLRTLKASIHAATAAAATKYATAQGAKNGSPCMAASESQRSNVTLWVRIMR